MLNAAEVILWGTTIGYLYLREGFEYASFEYNKDFLNSGIEVSPIKMPLSQKIYEFPNLAGGAFHGVPGLVADSLPDKFGNAVINQWLVSKQIPESEFNVIDRLCYTGSRGMGAIEYIPANGPGVNAEESVNVNEMVQFASDILNSRTKTDLNWEDNITKSQLLQMGTSAGGARAKAIIAWNQKTGDVRSGQIKTSADYDYWIIKFDGVSRNGDHGLYDEPQYTLIEYVYYQMALLAGITMNNCTIWQENGRNHFMTKRFDRVNGAKVHMQTLGALAHIDYNVPGLCGYEQAAGYMKQIGLGRSETEEFFRRMVFNVYAVNQDDHVKNISFLMDRTGKWSLAPAYDITFSYDETNKWLSAHQMTINGKKSKIEPQDILSAGKAMGISRQKCNSICEEVLEAVKNFRQLALDAGIKEQTVNLIEKVMQKNR